jgi:ribosomal protein S12 methylthiotransferase
MDGKATGVKVVTLGCPKNTVDSEAMMGLLRQRGYTLVDDAAGADVLVINTCAFIDSAKEESIDAIMEAAEIKGDGRPQKLIVTGCLAQRYARELADEIPEVDAFVGTSEFMHIADVIETVAAERRESPLLRVSSPAYQYTQPFPRVGVTPSHFAYLKIGEGCDNRCTFCAIPSFRGDYASRPVEALVLEAEALADSGVKELVLISQDTTFYGRDIAGQSLLPELLARLVRTDGIEWIRLLYLYPTLIDDALLEVIASEEKVCSYIDVPLQHIDEEILRRMARGTKEARLRALVPRLREAVPNVTLRTSFIVGFPGETDAQFESLVDFVVESRFEHCGVFKYSAEEGTPSASMGSQIDDEVTEERFLELVATQTEIAREQREQLVGTSVRVLVDGDKPDTPLVESRMASQAPEIDDVVYIRDARGAAAKSGSFVDVRVVEAFDFDLLAEVLPEVDGERER